jgi:hypothetical protein
LGEPENILIRRLRGMWNMNAIVGHSDILFITLDTLRYDIAQQAFEQARLPVLARYLPRRGWERRHSPGNFTYSAHQAFFAGFLPTPASPGPHPRLFAAEFPGSETTAPTTKTFDAPDIVAGLAGCGYLTICCGGVGFFNRRTPLGSVLPGLFQESHWDESWGVTCPASADNQVRWSCRRLAELPADRRVFLFLNASAIHQPNFMYLAGAREDSKESHLAALCYVDRALAPLLAAFENRGSFFAIVCSDHGTAYGEEGYHGHRLNHSVVGDVPYADFLWPR